MRIPIFHVNAFAEGPFSGNPAAVCLLDSWLDDGLLRKVAAENNLFATAFLVPAEDGYQLRWFTTRCEIRLCGHATLAAGFVVLNMHEPGRNMVHFETRYGAPLTVRRDGELFAMDFPALIPKRLETRPDGLAQSLGLNVEPSEVLEVNETYIAVLEDEDVVASAVPDFRHLEDLHPFAVAITALGKPEDFVSRYFAPSYGVPEDHVTGSVHCALAPYWSKRLGKTQLHSRQLSDRGGELWCEVAGEHVLLKGKAVLTMQGTLSI
ncbi:MAG: PhzF family phenazine biosynthesis protein [Candidatus Sulfotelmatobacter sp.]